MSVQTKRKINFRYKNFKCYVLPAILQREDNYERNDFDFLISGYVRWHNFHSGCYDRVQMFVALRQVGKSKNRYQIVRSVVLEGKDTVHLKYFPTMFLNFFLKRYFVEHKGLEIVDAELKPIRTSHASVRKTWFR